MGKRLFAGPGLAALAAVCLTANVWGQSVQLSHVDGLYAPDTVLAESTLVFHFTLTTDDTVYHGITNGFRIWSDDGAAWDTLYGAWSADITDSMFYYRVVPYRLVHGSVADTLGFAGFVYSSGDGLPRDTTLDYATLSVGPMGLEDVGKTICIDSSFYQPAGKWMWSPKLVDWNLMGIRPGWDGPRCYTIIATPDCCQNRGDVDDNSVVADVQDLIYLNDYVNSGGPPPPCQAQADVNGDGEVDASDVQYLQAYMFSGGPAPVPCE